MQPKSEKEYTDLLTSVIKKQMIILGPFITLVKARNVKGLTISDDGTVTAMSGNPQELIQALIDQFVQLSGLIVKKTMEPLLGNFDGFSQISTIVPPVVPAATIRTQTPPTAPAVSAPSVNPAPLITQAPSQTPAQTNPISQTIQSS